MAKRFPIKTRPAPTGNKDQPTLQTPQYFAANKKSYQAGKEVWWEGKKAVPETAFQLSEAETEILIPIWKRIKNGTLC